MSRISPMDADLAIFYINRMLDLAARHLTAGRPAPARHLCQNVLDLQPENREAMYLLARIVAREHDYTKAAELMRSVATPTTIDPSLLRDYADYHRRAGQHELAARHLKALAAQFPDNYSVWLHLAEIWLDSGSDEGFRQAVNHAAHLCNNRHGSYYELAALCEQAHLVSLTERYLRRALELSPQNTYYLGALANLLKRIGKADEAAPLYARLASGLPASSQNHETHTNHLMNYICTTTFTPEEVFEWHRQWGEDCCSHAERLAVGASLSRDPERPLNIGYVSADFCRHPVAFFIEPLLSTHDQQQFRVFLYASVPHEDYITEQLKQRPCTWRNIFNVSDDDACRMIREDGIDILVDLGGLTRKNRLPIFARKPAPLQITWLGYAHSTGLPTIDYRFTDDVADPPGMTEHLHTERLYRLPGGFLGYHPPLDPPALSPLPRETKGYTTFVAFNNLAKTNDRLLSWWAEILKQVPDARLMLKDASFSRDHVFREQWLARFAALGITADRLDLLDRSATVHDHLHSLGNGDIALDAYPYNGTTTTNETLWMGVPVVTLAGPSHVSRVSASLLTSVGVPELIAHTPEAYIECAVRLASDTERLRHYRANLRRMMQESSLMDYTGFTRAIETAYRTIWRQWCNGPAPEESP